MMRTLLSRFLLLLFCAMPLCAQIDARMLREPDVSATQIAFVYAGDIWVVPKTGGIAQRLRSHQSRTFVPERESWQFVERNQQHIRGTCANLGSLRPALFDCPRLGPRDILIAFLNTLSFRSGLIEIWDPIRYCFARERGLNSGTKTSAFDHRCRGGGGRGIRDHTSQASRCPRQFGRPEAPSPGEPFRQRESKTAPQGKDEGAVPADSD